MQIAENLVRSGITASDKFMKKLTETIQIGGLTKIIETGTHHGTGTTRAVLDAMDYDFEFFSIEVNPANYKIAHKNVGHVPGVHLINALSVGRGDLPVSISTDLPEFVVIDHQDASRVGLYNQEVSYKVADHGLEMALKAMDYKPDLVILDSAGHMGMIEFQYLMNRVAPDHQFYLALDDTDHYKHYETMEFIKSKPDKYDIIWQVRASHMDAIEGDKFGSAIIRVS